jgi:AcrR family transcriptional regulator
VLYGAQSSRRRDAQRNRVALIEAASEVMTSQDAVVSMPAIARRAGVSQATLYRHFPDRAAVAAAVVGFQIERLDAYAAANLHRPDAFRDMLREVLHTLVVMRPLVLLVRRLHPSVRARYQKRILASLAGPLRRAQDQGRVRRDLVDDDLVLLLTMVHSVAEADDDVTASRQAADRSIDLLLDGVFSTRTALSAS